MAKQLRQTKLVDIFQSKTTQKLQIDCVTSDTNIDANNTTVNNDPITSPTDLVCNAVLVETSSINVQENCPLDLSPINSQRPTMTSSTMKNFDFPKTAKERRCFQCSWLDTFEWLQYSKCADAAFCFACRLYDIDGKKEPTFTVTGFKSWKRACQKSSGFYKHEQTIAHIKAMQSWKEKLNRDENCSTVVELLSDHVLAKRRTYMKAIIEVIIFLVENELAFRGNWDSELHQEDGIFNNLFEFKLKGSPELRECQKVMPRNATYSSPIIQNEIISIITKQVKQLNKKRANMDNQRLRNLSYLAFEYKRLKDISVDDILKEFNDNPNRRIQLY